MKWLKEFDIPFKGLSLGLHNYTFEINKKFFDEIGYSEFEHGAITVHLELEKQEKMMILRFSIKGNVTVPCDRCLEDMKQRVDAEETLYVKFGGGKKQETDEIMVLQESEYKINVGNLINEYITLAVPMRHVHGVDRDGVTLCNVKTIEKLEAVNEKHNIDPRWEKLKEIKFN